MAKVTCITPDGYRGSDGDVGLNLQEGDTVDVSDAKHAQLKDDFPDWFDFTGKAHRPKKADPEDEE